MEVVEALGTVKCHRLTKNAVSEVSLDSGPI